jgi:hypothetical protein
MDFTSDLALRNASPEEGAAMPASAVAVRCAPAPRPRRLSKYSGKGRWPGAAC